MHLIESSLDNFFFLNAWTASKCIDQIQRRSIDAVSLQCCATMSRCSEINYDIGNQVEPQKILGKFSKLNSRMNKLNSFFIELYFSRRKVQCIALAAIAPTLSHTHTPSQENQMILLAYLTPHLWCSHLTVSRPWFFLEFVFDLPKYYKF